MVACGDDDPATATPSPSKVAAALGEWSMGLDRDAAPADVVHA